MSPKLTAFRSGLKLAFVGFFFVVVFLSKPTNTYVCGVLLEQEVRLSSPEPCLSGNTWAAASLGMALKIVLPV